MMAFVIAAIFIWVGCPALARADTNEGSEECAIADGKVVVNNPLSNWETKNYGGKNSCYLEKTHSKSVVN